MQPHVLLAVVKKELTGYFSSPVGYVFITLFVFLSGLAAFWLPGFFDRNLANLDQLNAWYGVLLLFLIPAITMAAWAEERREGTDELLLTLPAREIELVLGKYLGCLAIYAVCLLFASSHIFVLAFLGRPDAGLTLSTYLGYFLAGAALTALGLAASSLSSSATISYIAGALACGAFVAIGLLNTLMPGSLIGRATLELSIPERMSALARGVVNLADIAYFVGVAVLGITLTVAVVAARRSTGRRVPFAERLHWPLRGLSLCLILACAFILLDRAALRADATAERLWTISAPTRALLDRLPADRPLVISAYVSRTVPESLVQQRESLLGLLREVAARSHGKVQTRVISTEPNTEAARDAERSLGIRPRPVPTDPGAGAPGSTQDVFLAFAVAGPGNEPSVVEFLSRGLSAEYELTRAIAAASAQGRKRVGILETAANLFGQFNFQTMQMGRDWPIVAELRKQFTVVKISPGAPVPADIDVLLVAQPSSLRPDELANVVDYVKAGRAAAIFEDPMPMTNPELATAEPTRPAGNPMMGRQGGEPKADIRPLWEALGARVPGDAVVWDPTNPHRELAETPPEFIWVNRLTRGSAAAPGFNDTDQITSGLQETVLLFSGRIERPSADATPTTEITPLLRSSPVSGQVAYSSILQRGPFGISGLNPARKPIRTNQQQTLAARITGGPGEKKLNTLLVADLDMISETFFAIRESGATGFEFDNVTFILNAIDVLAGDDTLVDLRKRRRTFRTLERIEVRRQAETQATLDAVAAAEADAESKLAEARARFDARLKEIDSQKDLDDTTRQIMAESVRQAEQRKLDAASRQIEDRKKQMIEDARLTTRIQIDRIQMGIRIAAVSLPPVPALALGLFVLVRRRAQERQLVAQTDATRMAR